MATRTGSADDPAQGERPRVRVFSIICFIQVVAFACHLYAYDTEDKPVGILHGPVPSDSRFIYDPDKVREAWRFVSYILVHLSGVHLYSSLMWQIDYGDALVLDFGWWRVLIIYFFGVLATSLWICITNPEVFLCGGAGGVFALIFADFTSVIISWDDFQSTREGVNVQEEALFVMVYFLWDVNNVYFLSSMKAWDNQKSHIEDGWGSLLAGGCAGAFMAFVLLRHQRKRQWGRVVTGITFCRKYMVLIATLTWLAVMALAMWNVKHPDRKILFKH